MREAGVPLLPGSDGTVPNLGEARQAARRIGYPVIIKAVAGGGGRGMRVASNDAELTRLMPLAQAEAEAAFGNGGVYLERYLDRPRHVEVQILADHHGHVAGIGRARLLVAAAAPEGARGGARPEPPAQDAREPAAGGRRRAQRAVGYTNAGTLEFLVDQRGPLLLHGDEHPHPGRAPGHRDGHRGRSGRLADPDRGG